MPNKYLEFFGSSNITFGSQSSNTTVDTSSEEPAKVSGITFGSSNITFGSQSSNTTVDASSEEPAKVSGVTLVVVLPPLEANL